MMKTHVAHIVLAAAFLAGCSAKKTELPESGPSASLRVAVVNYPLKYFAETIGGNRVEVIYPVPEGEDPAFWKPNPEQVSLYQQADCILLNGANYAKWVASASLPDSRVVDTSRSFENKLIKIEGATTHSHGPTGMHAHGGFAFTTWLDLQLAVAQARAIRDALVVKLPESRAELDERFAALEKELLAIDADLREIFKNNRGHKFIFSHPVYQYFARAYGVDGRSVHWEPEEFPTEAMWADFVRLRNEYPADIMIWEKEPRPETRKRLSEMGMTCVVVDPCGGLPESGDLLSVLRENAEVLAAIALERDRSIQGAGDSGGR